MFHKITLQQQYMKNYFVDYRRTLSIDINAIAGVKAEIWWPYSEIYTSPTLSTITQA